LRTGRTRSRIQIDAIEQKIGAKVLDESFIDPDGDSGAPLRCGRTGVVLLSSDKISVVLADALPADGAKADCATP
jgi:hypothetical protein